MGVLHPTKPTEPASFPIHAVVVGQALPPFAKTGTNAELARFSLLA